MANKELSPDEIGVLLSQTSGRGPRKDPTEPREDVVWFKLNHTIREEGCENPNCLDTRSRDDRGVKITSQVKGKFMCRYCFTGGWLSETTTSS